MGQANPVSLDATVSMDTDWQIAYHIVHRVTE